MDALLRAASTIEKYSMLRGGEKVLVALSGGPDSVCLTSVLHTLSGRLDIKLHALYVDHGLRPAETPAEAEFCRGLCESLQIPFSVKCVDVKAHCKARGLNKQEAARDLRYGALETLGMEIKAERIALGHTLDDQVETFLMRILRGSGVRGLSGIPPVRGKIIRPLIETDRRQIEAYLSGAGIGFVTDSSNIEDEYLRNRLRSVLIPALKAMSPDVMKTLAHTTDVFREEDAYLEIMVTKEMIKLISRKTDTSIELFGLPLENMDRVILRRVLRRAVQETAGLRGLGLAHTEEIIRLVKKGRAGDRLDLPKGLRAIKKYSTILLTSDPPRRLGTHVIGSEAEVRDEQSGLVIKVSVSSLKPPPGKVNMTALDADKARFPLTLRPRKDGDYFHPEGFGKKKKLQDFFVDEKVPRDDRDSVPLVTCGDEIACVVGMRADDKYKVTKDTSRFLLVEIVD